MGDVQHVVERPREQPAVGGGEPPDERGGLARGAHRVAVGHLAGEGAAHGGGGGAEAGHGERERHAGVDGERRERPPARAAVA